MARKLNSDILKDALPANVERIVDGVAANLDRAVDKVVDSFKEHAASVVRQMESGAFPKALEAELAKVTMDLDGEFAAFARSAGEIRAAAEALQKQLSQAEQQAGELTLPVGDLAKVAASLDAKVNALRERVASFGKQVGATVGSAAVRLFTDGLG
jgi:chromosome segregation ATPase